MDMFHVVTILRSIMWFMLSAIMLLGLRDYFKSRYPSYESVRKIAKPIMWAVVVMNAGIMLYTIYSIF